MDSWKNPLALALLLAGIVTTSFMVINPPGSFASCPSIAPGQQVTCGGGYIPLTDQIITALGIIAIGGAVVLFLVSSGTKEGLPTPTRNPTE